MRAARIRYATSSASKRRTLAMEALAATVLME